MPLLVQVLTSYGTEWVVRIEDVTGFVQEQYEHVKKGQLNELLVPEERVYTVTDHKIATQIRVDRTN